MANVIQTFPKGTGGGHTILDTTGTSVTDRKEMQFKGLSVTDNSTDEVTEIEGVGLNQDSLNDIASANISNVMVGGGDNYSTSEQIIGRWIDGKPIYQRVLDGITFNGDAIVTIYTFPTGEAVDKVIYGRFIRNTYNGVTTNNAKSSITMNVFSSNGTTNISGYVSGASGTQYGQVIIQYTKA